MFDVGFWELTIIAIVALLVIGPERLPGVARTVGLWLGRIRGFVTSVKADIDRELKADELKRIMEKQAESTGLHEFVEETERAINNIEQPDYLVRNPDNERYVQEELARMSGDVTPSSTPQDAAAQSSGKPAEDPPPKAVSASDSPDQTDTTDDQKTHGGSEKQR